MHYVLKVDARGMPLGVWTSGGMSKGVKVDFRAIETFGDAEDAWGIVGRHHVAGEVWSVMSTSQLARKLRRSKQ